MKLKYTRILSLVLCAAIACSALVGCGGSAACVDADVVEVQFGHCVQQRGSFRRGFAGLHRAGQHVRPEPRRL